jgi:hypothetical protein
MCPQSRAVTVPVTCPVMHATADDRRVRHGVGPDVRFANDRSAVQDDETWLRKAFSCQFCMPHPAASPLPLTPPMPNDR